jgi:hypothetical protein
LELTRSALFNAHEEGTGRAAGGAATRWFLQMLQE